MGRAPPPRDLTGEEAALYDRQIRLWGLEAQRRLSAAHVLIIGAPCSMLGHEMCKNVLLSGVARLALCQTVPVRAGFLGADVEATAAALRAMNPHVKVDIVGEETESGGGVGGGEWRVVCAVGMGGAGEKRVGEECRGRGIAFMGGRVVGGMGWVFLDLGAEYKCQVKRKKKPGGEEKVEKSEELVVRYCSYEEAVEGRWGGESRQGEFGWHVAGVVRAFEGAHGRLPDGGEADQEVVRELYRRIAREKGAKEVNEGVVEGIGGGELAAVAAIVGGLWGREVVKVVSGKEQPVNNFVFFNARSSAASVEKVGPVV